MIEDGNEDLGVIELSVTVPVVSAPSWVEAGRPTDGPTVAAFPNGDVVTRQEPSAWM